MFCVVGFDLVGRDDDLFRADIFVFHRIDDELFFQALAVGLLRNALLLEGLDHSDAVAEPVANPAFHLFVDVALRELIVAGAFAGFEFIQDKLPLDEELHRVAPELFDLLLKDGWLPAVLEAQQAHGFFVDLVLNFP